LVAWIFDAELKVCRQDDSGVTNEPRKKLTNSLFTTQQKADSMGDETGFKAQGARDANAMWTQQRRGHAGCGKTSISYCSAKINW
jgi:hypothetical protein